MRKLTDDQIVKLAQDVTEDLMVSFRKHLKSLGLQKMSGSEIMAVLTYFLYIMAARVLHAQEDAEPNDPD